MNENRSHVTFPETRWSLVVRGGEAEALDDLCSIYWKPVYSYLRQQGYAPSDAEDATQSFFQVLLSKDIFERASEEKGRLRSYLLGALKRHLVSAYRRESAQKRGGQKGHLPMATSELDFDEEEVAYAAEPREEVTAEQIFERRWVIQLLERAGERLRRDYEATGKGKEYELLQGVLGEKEVALDYEKVAQKLGVKEASVRVMVHRLRRNFRAAFRDEIAETVAHHDDVEEEFQRLLGIFS